MSHAQKVNCVQLMAKLEFSLDTLLTLEMVTTPHMELSSRTSSLAHPAIMPRVHLVSSTDSLNALLVSLVKPAQKALVKGLALKTLLTVSLATIASVRPVLVIKVLCIFVSTPAQRENTSRQEAARLSLTAKHALLASIVLLDLTVNVTAHLDTTVRQVNL